MGHGHGRLFSTTRSRRTTRAGSNSSPWCRSSASTARSSTPPALGLRSRRGGNRQGHDPLALWHGPYVYAAERNALDQGVGLVRPLMVEFPDHPHSADVPNQWMFGDWLLAAPVSGNRTRTLKASRPTRPSIFRRGSGSTTPEAMS